MSRLFVDPDTVRGYGSASSTHAAGLHGISARLSAVDAGIELFGPVGARFVAALARAAGEQSQVVAALGDSLTAARAAAYGSARAYEGADDDAATRIRM